MPISQKSYAELLRHARRATRRAEEAEDLLQTVLLAAIKVGRTDFSCSRTRWWLAGALRKRALFDARSAARRRRRETSIDPEGSLDASADTGAAEFVHTLSPSLQTTAFLALTGHTKAEIACLLRLPDTAVRQRIAQIRKRWLKTQGREGEIPPGLAGGLAFGRIRRSLLPWVGRQGVILASHDPDGNLFVIRSQIRGSRQQA
jgi:DNA-directed RNA polymerase specialized sigma24 family protein